MARHAPNPSAVDAGFPIHPKDEYELVIGEPKVFKGVGKEGKPDNFGVRFICIIAEGAQAGKKFIKNCYMHTPESEGFAKQFQMAALGFNPKNQDDEAKFNEKYGNADWSFDDDTMTAGEAWHEMKGKRVYASLDVGTNKVTGDPAQLEKGYRPFGV
jgi:hypothetical protein